MSSQYITTMPTDSKDRARRIKRFILEEDQKTREKYPILGHQDLIGLSIWFVSLAVISAVSYLYFVGMIPRYAVIVLNALAVSSLHELEHDLIHNQYFKGNKYMQSLMFLFIYIFKFHGNPWWRRDVHHWHHRVSGQTNDVEERLLGLGMNFDLRRLGVTLHPAGFVSEIKDIKKDAKEALDLRYMNRSNMFVSLCINLMLKAYPIFIGLRMLNIVQLDDTFALLSNFMICLFYPMCLRHMCLILMTTGCHYYGDIPKNDVFFQNQVLDSYWVLPFNIFCWEFSGTHVIHHYVPSQPFYLRQLIAPQVKNYMEAQGMRRNDWGIYLRANRWNMTEDQAKKAKLSAMVWYMASILAPVYMVLYDVFLTPTVMKVLTLFLYRGVFGGEKKSKEFDYYGENEKEVKDMKAKEVKAE